MSDISSKKQRFIEHVTTLGGLLAVFLGFVVDKTSFYLSYVIAFGILLIVSALFSYTAVLFRNEIENGLIRRFAFLSYLFLGISFGGLITTGVALVLSTIPGTYPTALVYALATIAIAAPMVGTLVLVVRVLNLPDARPKG